MLNNSRAADLERERERARLLHAVEEQEHRKESANLRIAIKQSNRKVKKEKELKKEEEEEMKKMKEKEKEWKGSDKYHDKYTGNPDYHYRDGHGVHYKDHPDDGHYNEHSNNNNKEHPHDHYEGHSDDHYNYDKHPEDYHGNNAEHDGHPNSQYNNGHHDDHDDGHIDDHYNNHHPDDNNHHSDNYYKDHPDSHYNGHGDEHYNYPGDHHEGDHGNHHNDGPYHDEEHGNHYSDHPDGHYDDHPDGHYDDHPDAHYIMADHPNDDHGNHNSDHHGDHGHYNEEGCGAHGDEHECGDSKSDVGQQNKTISLGNSTEQLKLHLSILEGWKAQLNDSDPSSIAVMVPTNDTKAEIAEIAKDVKESKEIKLKSEAKKKEDSKGKENAKMSEDGKEKENSKMAEHVKAVSDKASSSSSEDSEGVSELPPLTAKIGVGSLNVSNLSVAILIPQNIQDLLGLKAFQPKDAAPQIMEGLNTETIKKCIDQLKIKPNSEENSVCKQVISNLGREVVDRFASVTQVNNMKVLYNGKEDKARTPLVAQTNSLKVNYENESKLNPTQTNVNGMGSHPATPAVSALAEPENKTIVAQAKNDEADKVIKNKQVTLSQFVNKTKTAENHQQNILPNDESGSVDKPAPQSEEKVNAVQNGKPNVVLLNVPALTQKEKDSSATAGLASKNKENPATLKMASTEKESVQAEPSFSEKIQYNGKPALNNNKLKKELDESLLNEQLNSLSDTLSNTMKDAFNGMYDAGLTPSDFNKKNQA